MSLQSISSLPTDNLYKFVAIFALNKLTNTLHYMLLREVDVTQFDVKWAISRKRGHSENIRIYYTLGCF